MPVLSRHSTSTRARSSIEYSDCTSVCRRARRTTPTASATLVKSTSPSGIMPIIAATVETTLSSSGCAPRKNCRANRISPSGTMAKLSPRISAFSARISSDLTDLSSLASRARLAA